MMTAAGDRNYTRLLSSDVTLQAVSMHSNLSTGPALPGPAPTIGIFRRLAVLAFNTLSLLHAGIASAQSAWDYGDRGLEWSDGTTGSYLWLGLRAQFRYSTNINDLRLPEDFEEDADAGGRVNRSRYKVGAGYRNDFTFYHEYDLRDRRLLDLRATWVANPSINLRVGQWKADYNRARIDSSGKQQFAERSIATYWFTIDRQWGVMMSGRLWQGSGLDSNWWGGILGGNGRSEADDGGRPMLMGRWQWNYTGNSLPFSQSALKRYSRPHASLAFGAVANDSRYTRFSSDGGGQLPGYVHGEQNQYRIYQAMQEWAWQHQGLSFQQELHWKSIEDRREGGTRHLFGGYAQVGWFPADRWQSVPEQLELALRAAYVDADSAANLEQTELSVAVNWFFSGHRNKVTLDGAYISAEDRADKESDYRLQLQWEISI
jgi:phosphate-selective porin OprO/OprP